MRKSYLFFASLFLIFFAGACTAEQTPVSLPPTPEVLHPEFILSQKDWVSILESLPMEIRGLIHENPTQFLEDYKKLFNSSKDSMILVDKKNFLSAEYKPNDLVSLNEYPILVSRKDLYLRETIMGQVLALNKAARDKGLTLLFSSSYRSYQYQKGLFDRYVAQDGLEEAQRYSARPGTSQHQLGTAIDFGSITEAFAKTPEGKWLKENAGRFGFSLSYPQDYEEVTGYMWEPWHYRYIGVEACQIQQRWFGNVQQYLLEFHKKWGDFLKERWNTPT